MNATPGYRGIWMKHSDGGRKPCIHGDLCKDYMKNFKAIKSTHCPYGCKYYVPKEDENENN